jgi:ATP-dependent exoDNAse (exonuclease V) beta subunit
LPASAAAIPVDAAARRRFSFSGLTGHIAIERELPSDALESNDGDELVAPITPEAGHEFEVDGRLLGTLVHAALERVDFRRSARAGEACRRVAAQMPEVIPEEVVAEAIAVVERILASPRAAELARAAVLRREVEFLLPWPPEGAGFTGKYLHGFIDCLYQDGDGQWHLLDFKTNRIAPNRVRQTAARYEMQMLVYLLACEQALGQPLAESTLVFLHPGAEYAWQWDADARRSGMKRVSAAMEALIESERK